MTDQELKDLVASLSVAQKETDRELKEINQKLRKKRTKLGEQFYNFENKFGIFEEGQAFPAMRKILQERFGIETTCQRVESAVFDEYQEIDVLAYSNGTRNEAFVVEVKSFLNDRDLAQVLNIMEKFPRAFPEHANKKLYGIVAYVEVPNQEILQKTLDAGLYLAAIHDEHFQLTVPNGFQPKQFNPLLNK